MKCILLAVDDRPIKGMKTAPYAMNTMGLPLFAQNLKGIQGAGYEVDCIMADSIQNQIAKIDTSVTEVYKTTPYSEIGRAHV